MATRIQMRRDAAATWLVANPVLAQGEMGWELDTGRAKLGNGTSSWSDLPYVVGNPASGNDKSYTHDQTTPSDTWTINHFLDKFPSVSIVDSAGTQVEGEVVYESINQLVVTFSGAFSGKAYLN